jgi:hypothetical protein
MVDRGVMDAINCQATGLTYGYGCQATITDTPNGTSRAMKSSKHTVAMDSQCCAKAEVVLLVRLVAIEETVQRAELLGFIVISHMHATDVRLPFGR